MGRASPAATAFLHIRLPGLLPAFSDSTPGRYTWDVTSSTARLQREKGSPINSLIFLAAWDRLSSLSFFLFTQNGLGKGDDRLESLSHAAKYRLL